MNNSGCKYEDCNGHCTLNECMYGDFLERDDSRFDTGKYCFATCDELADKLKEQNK